MTLSGKTLRLGRGAQVDLCLPDPTVGPLHASVRQRGRLLLVEDEGSLNGTFVRRPGEPGELRLQKDSPHFLSAGDLLRLGEVELSLSLTEPDAGVIVISAADFPRALVHAALEDAGLASTEEATEAALTELLQSPVELRPEDAAVVAAAPEGEIEARHSPLLLDPRLLDRSLSLLATVVLLGFGAALYLILRESP